MRLILPLTAVLLCVADASAQQVHKLDATPKTVTWGYYDATVPPVLTVRSGDSVMVHTLLGLDPRLLEAAGYKAEAAVSDVYREVTKGPGGHMLTGPIFVEGAEPGDTLEVQIEQVKLALPYAYNRFRPGAGYLQDDFPYTVLRVIPLDRDRMVAKFAPGVEIPSRPFFGSIGVAPPPETGRVNSGPPWFHGGNLDNKELTSGTRLFLPVHVRGALLSVGDGHAAQGNGEVTLTALETALDGTLKLIVHKNMRLKWPRAETATHYISMGLHQDLNEATKAAVREMIDFLVSDKKLSRDDAYMLCSVAGDLAITQLVDQTVGVHMLMPKELFKSSGATR